MSMTSATFQPMKIYQHTKLGYKRFSSSEDGILNLWCDPDIKHRNAVFSLDTFSYDDLPSVWMQKYP